MVPSSGSSTHRSPLVPRDVPVSSPSDGVVGALARERLEQQRLGVSIGVRDQVDGRRFGFEPADRPAEALEQKGTAAMGHVHRQLVEGSLVHRGSVRVGQVVTTCEKCENSWESCCKVLEIRTR